LSTNNLVTSDNEVPWFEQSQILGQFRGHGNEAIGQGAVLDKDGKDKAKPEANERQERQ